MYEAPSLEDFPVLHEFNKMFEEVPSFRPKKDIDFCIDPVPWATPFSKIPCRMSTPELKEWHMQLEESLKKEYIRTCVPLGSTSAICK